MYAMEPLLEPGEVTRSLVWAREIAETTEARASVAAHTHPLGGAPA